MAADQPTIKNQERTAGATAPSPDDSEISSELSSSDEESDSEDSDSSSESLSDQTRQEEPPLKDRLKAFLPQLQQANHQLDQANSRSTGGFELREENSEEEDEGYSSEAEDGPYIEMNLGLGVLEQMAADKPDDEVAIPAQGDREFQQPRKRNADAVDREDALAALTAIERSHNGPDDRRKKSKRSKIEVVESAKDVT